MALEQNAETVDLVVRASLDRRGFRPKLAMVAQQYVDQRRFHTQHCAECGKQQFLFKLQMVDQPIFNPRMTVSWRDVSQEMFLSPLNLRIPDARTAPMASI